MSRGFRKVKAQYNKDTKTLILDATKLDVVPSYAYYMSEYMQEKEQIEIEYLQFINEDLVYKLSDLKGKYDWTDVEHV